MNNATEQEARETLKRKMMRYGLLGEEIRWVRIEMRQCCRQQRELRQGMMEQSASAKGIEMMGYSYRLQEKVLVRRIYKLQSERTWIEQMLSGLESEERAVLRLKLLEGRPWVYVAMKVYLSERQCQRIQRRALDKILDHMSHRKSEIPQRCRTVSGGGG